MSPFPSTVSKFLSLVLPRPKRPKPRGTQAVCAVLVVRLFDFISAFSELASPQASTTTTCPPTTPTTARRPLCYLLLNTVRTKPDSTIYSLVALATLPTVVSMRTTWRLRGHRHEDQSFRTTAL